MTASIANDLLGLTMYSEHLPESKTMLGECLDNESPKVVEATARLVNAFASLCRGRVYLAQNNGTVTLLTRRIFEESDESVTRENLIGALQKLSLR